MAKKQKTFRPKARAPKGLRDVSAEALRAEASTLARIAEVYESYGFEPLETGALEYADALGKFLPDEDRPNEGVFSFEDDDGQWLALRYDLTAPLARYVAENYDRLPKPFRRYASGPVWRNEKPGPGRFRQFTQIDADTVGAPGVAADAEMVMMLADCMEALGLGGHYVVRVNNRKVLDCVLETIGIDPQAEDFERQKLTILRAIDKLDRLGPDAVRQLLGKGRKDESGDFTEGAHLTDDQIDAVMAFTETAGEGRGPTVEAMEKLAGGSKTGGEGVEELETIAGLIESAGYGEDRIVIDPSVVRGLGYYTGPVFEVELTFEAEDERGELARFGSVASGGRYDDLVARFRGQKVPATGCSVGVSRLVAALDALGKLEGAAVPAPVVVLVMDESRLQDFQAMTRELRAAGIRAEMYLGSSGMRAQLKYADKRGAPVAVIQGEDEASEGAVTLKDLALGEALSKEIADNEEWREGAHAQETVPREELVPAVKTILARHRG